MLLCYSANIALKGQTRKRVALRGFSLGNQAFPRACEQGHLYKPATRPARRIGQGKTFPRPIFLAGFISSRKLTQLGLQTSLCIKGFEVFRWKEITFTFTWNHNIFFFLFLKALDEQEVALKQQIVHLEKQVKESTPDKAKLKQLQDAVKKHEKGKKY